MDHDESDYVHPMVGVQVELECEQGEDWEHRTGLGMYAADHGLAPVCKTCRRRMDVVAHWTTGARYWLAICHLCANIARRLELNERGQEHPTRGL